MVLPSIPQDSSPGAGASQEALRPASLSYTTSESVNAPRYARAAGRLYATGWLMILLALLISWCLFDIFVLRWHYAREAFVIGGRVIRARGDLEAVFLWDELPRPMVLVFPVLMVFAGVYFLLARLVARGNRSAFAAATIIAMVHGLIAALWLLTFVVVGYALIRRAVVWWVLTLDVAGLALSVFMVPWLVALTLLLMRGTRRR